MTVEELIEELNKVEDKNKPVVFAEEGWTREVTYITENNTKVWLGW